MFRTVAMCAIFYRTRKGTVNILSYSFIYYLPQYINNKLQWYNTFSYQTEALCKAHISHNGHLIYILLVYLRVITTDNLSCSKWC
jgi:hypothetical protein